MAAADFSVLVHMTFPGGATQVGQATTFQVITPWGQTVACYNFFEAVNDAFNGKGGTPFTGRMGNYFLNGTVNGASGSGTAPFTSANAFENTP